MNAQEAKQMAQRFITESHDSQLAEILGSVKEQAGKGELEMWYYKPIRKDVVVELERLGYEIGKPQSDRNETLIKISWS